MGIHDICLPHRGFNLMVRCNSPSPVRARDNNKEDQGLKHAARVGTPRSIWEPMAERSCSRCRYTFESVSA